MLTRRRFVFEAPAAVVGAGMAGTAAAAAAAGASAAPHIRQIDIVHHTHTDVGYTDAPSVVRDRQQRYLDTAIDVCLGDRSFRWTVESLLELDDWWKNRPAERRAALTRLVRAGQMDVMGLPFNQTPFLNALEWRQMMSWIPAEVWRAVNPRAAMQNDVNGFPRAGAMALLDHGIRHLLMGINADSGGPPFRRPAALWWKQPDGRRLFVWLGEHYGSAMGYFGAPRVGFDLSEKAVRAAQARAAERVRKLEADGYEHERVILTFTHPAGYDNGWPYASLSGFVEAWNRLSLEPKLRLVTATQAVSEMEELVGKFVPELAGEWTDWWANGDASAPREVAASRAAKRYLEAALSPVWGPMPSSAAASVEAILRDLCLFDEHTWGAAASVSAPYSLKSIGQWVEKSELAYRPMGQAEWLLERRARTRFEPLAAGTWVANASPAEVSGWAKAPGAAEAVWVESLEANSIRRVVEPGPGNAIAGGGDQASGQPSVSVDENGWPVSATWTGMRKPLFAAGLANFIGIELVPPANRSTITGLHATPEADKRKAIREGALKQSGAVYAQAFRRETPHTLVYTQEFRHPRLERARRTVELWRREPRARVNVRFDRIGSTDPELFYLAFALPEGLPLPVLASGGVPFTPYRDQLRGTCRDYFAIDGWAHYVTGEADWLWVSRDAPLVALGGPHALERHQSEPAEPHRILALVFDNCWHTNFVADSHGAMEFQFELAWRANIARPAELAEALAAEPVVAVNTGEREPPAVIRDLYRP